MTPPPLERLRRWAGLKPRLAPDEQGDRLVYANAPARNADYCDNLVITLVAAAATREGGESPYMLLGTMRRDYFCTGGGPGDP